MTGWHTSFLFILLVVLLLLSAFFSGSETGMMACNRYRMRHLARKGNPAARRVLQLLERPDRLLGVILIGNTFANVLASAIATILAVQLWGDIAVVISTFALALIILMFAESTPKTFAALHPERFAQRVSWPLQLLLTGLYPVVWLISSVANGVLSLFGIKVRKKHYQPMSTDELHSVVRDMSGHIPDDYQRMLLRVLDLREVTVADVMVPRSDIDGIDINEPWDKMVYQLTHAVHAVLPLYRDHIDQVLGMLDVRRVLSRLHEGSVTKNKILLLASKVYFVPESALLNRQLINFQDQQQSVGLVVDEYGEIQGLVTLQDILEEIVGEFAHGGMDDPARLIKRLKDGSILVDGRITVRDLCRVTHWQLPMDGPKTLSGAIVEQLEMIPATGVGVRLAGYPMEIKQVSGNTIRLIQVWPHLYQRESDS